MENLKRRVRLIDNMLKTISELNKTQKYVVEILTVMQATVVVFPV